jgi:hypothetical protein
MFGRFANLVGHPSTTNSDRLSRDGNMGDGPGNFSVGDVTYFDGCSMSQPSDAIQGLLELLSVMLAPHGNPNSVFPFTACDIAVAKVEDLVRFTMEVFSALSGYDLEILEEDDKNGTIVNHMCLEGRYNFSVKLSFGWSSRINRDKC